MGEVFPATLHHACGSLAICCRRRAASNIILGGVFLRPKWNSQAPLLVLLLPGGANLILLYLKYRNVLVLLLFKTKQNHCYCCFMTLLWNCFCTVFGFWNAFLFSLSWATLSMIPFVGKWHMNTIMNMNEWMNFCFHQNSLHRIWLYFFVQGRRIHRIKMSEKYGFPLFIAFSGCCAWCTNNEY